MGGGGSGAHIIHGRWERSVGTVADHGGNRQQESNSGGKKVGTCCLVDRIKHDEGGWSRSSWAVEETSGNVSEWWRRAVEETPLQPD